MPFKYRVYGLNVESDLELPELSPARDGSTDVSIQMGDVPDHLEGGRIFRTWIEATADACLVKSPGVGRYLVKDGRTITVDRRIDREKERGSGCPPTDLRLYLLGSALGALLHQRGDLPLHVGAVQMSQGAWAFTGPSGAGKSTLVGWLMQKRGWEICSDDVSVVRPDRGMPHVYPGPRKLKLCEDAVDHLGFRDEKLVRDLSHSQKFQLYFAEDNPPKDPQPLRALVLLEVAADEETPSLVRLNGTEAFAACMFAIYRPYMAKWFRDPAALLKDVAQLADQIDVYRLRRRWTLASMEEQLRPLLERMR